MTRGVGPRIAGDLIRRACDEVMSSGKAELKAYELLARRILNNASQSTKTADVQSGRSTGPSKNSGSNSGQSC